MNKSTQKLMLGGSTAALFAAMPVAAFAQDSSGIEQVVVSASRIQIAGYQQPTPVSVIGATQLLEAANADVGDTLREMPSMGNSQTPEKGTNANGSNTGAVGVSGINLRNLGATRNLVLVDGQRVVYAGLTAGVDLSVIPSSLVQRVDVVTGGASAAWGSDAVSGVVNLIINKNFTGLKASIDLQDTGQDTRRSYGFTVTNGFDMFGGRSHVEWAVTYNDNPDTVFLSQAKWFTNQSYIANPLYNATTNPKVPQLVAVNGSGQRDVPGGDTAANTGAAAALNGIQFGPGGILENYKLGDCSYYASTNLPPYIATTTTNATSICYGGTSSQSTSSAQIDVLSFPIEQGTGFFYDSYKITPDIQASLQLNYGYDRSHSSSSTIVQSAVIKSDNAYLNPSVGATMKADGVTQITVTGTGSDGVNLANPGDLVNFQNAIGSPEAESVRQLYRAVATLDGAIGDNWSWSAYYQHSESHLFEFYPHIEITQNYANAVDAVTVTAANSVGTGLIPGTIACRTTLAAPTNGCVPLDVMGIGVGNPLAINYVEDHNDFYHLNMQEDSAGLSMQGILPWDLIGAGAPSTAFGVEYRKEAAVATADPYGVVGGLGGGNFTPIHGEYNVIEGFAELDIPIIKNGIVESLDGNMAGRMTSYSTSGLVETWKLGLTSQVNDDIRLRFTMSYDIRAPNLGELYSIVPASGGSVDYKNNLTVSSVLTVAAGSVNLTPEAATTYSGGIVLTPHWVPGLTMSFDWYSIDLKSIIVSPSSTFERTACLANTLNPAGGSYCNDWVYNPALVVPGTNPNGLQFVYTYPFNNGFLTTSGLDFVADYAMDFWNGNLAWHLAGNYTDEETESEFGVLTAAGAQASYDFAGSMSGNSPFAGVPKTHITLSATYTEGPWSGTVQTRYIGAAQLVNGWTSGIQLANNNVAQVAYLDLRGTYRWNDNMQFYLSVDNVFDTPPPSTAGTIGSGSTNFAETNAAEYDILGRMWHTGVRFTF
jgi:outer membrane receptor protein involved in Fe transport